MKKWNNIFFVKKDPAKMHIKMSNVGLKYVTWNVFQLDQFFFILRTILKITLDKPMFLF